jgi:hypothetical protein
MEQPHETVRDRRCVGWPATGYGGTGDDAEASSIQRGGDEFRRASFGLSMAAKTRA